MVGRPEAVVVVVAATVAKGIVGVMVVVANDEGFGFARFI